MTSPVLNLKNQTPKGAITKWFGDILLPKAKQHLIYTMVSSGLLLMALGTFLPSSPGSLWDKMLSLLLSFGSALIGGGVFAALLKSAQFTELFQKHIFDVFHNPHKLKNLVSIEERWGALTEALLNDVLPTHKGLARANLKEQFFDNELEYHMEDLTMKYSIIIHSETNRVQIINRATQKVVINPNKENPLFVQGAGTRDKSHTPMLTELIINDEPITNFSEYTHPTDEDENDMKIQVPLNRFAGEDRGKPITIDRVLTFDQDLTTEPYINCNFTRFIKEARIEVDINTTEYGLLFQRTGNWGNGSTAKGTYDRVCDSKGKWVLARRDELLMPGQGFIIMIVPKSQSKEEESK